MKPCFHILIDSHSADHSTEPPMPTSAPGGAVCASGSGTLCGVITTEPIPADVMAVREATSCMLDTNLVEAISPLNPTNPENVKNVEAIFTETQFDDFYPLCPDSKPWGCGRDKAYTYVNFLKAIGKYPSICKFAATCPKILANMFAHFQQETAGLYYLREIGEPSGYCSNGMYPCTAGQKYYGRGAKQLSWNYNYGAFSNAMYGDPQVLLDDPDRVATTWLNFAATMWFYVTPQPPKPSMLEVVDGSWVPNAADTAANRLPGLGASIMILNGAIECGPNPGNPTAADNRGKYYKDFAGRLNVDINGEKLDCKNMDAFSQHGTGGSLKIYWDNTMNCKLVSWQTAFSALVEGDYARCQGKCSGGSTGGSTGGNTGGTTESTTGGSSGGSTGGKLNMNTPRNTFENDLLFL